MRKLNKNWTIFIKIVSYAFVAFQVYTAGFGALSDMLQRSIHLAFVLTLAFILKPATKKAPKDKVPVYDVLLVAFSIASCIFIALNYNKIAWDPLRWYGAFDKPFAIMMLLIAFEAARRATGLTFPIMGMILIVYALLGPMFPSIWGHKGFTFDYILQTFYHSSNGLWGSMIGMSATMLAMFTIFGAALSKTGGASMFIKIGQMTAGRRTGGSGKVALIGSGLFGMISGSPMANVVATGTYTIPYMKDAGYDDEWSAAIASVGSTGGALMPPIMGAAAFIMSDLISKPYADIALAGMIPAILFYAGAYSSVHFISKKFGVLGSKTIEKPKFSEVSTILFPTAIFVAMLIAGFSVTYSAFWATIGSIITSIVIDICSKKKVKQLVKSNGKMILGIAEQGAKDVISMAGLVCGAQIIVTMISMTGIGVKISNLIVSIGQNNLFPCLLLALVVCVLLGMGLPMAAAYLLAAAVLASALTQLGLPVFVAHMFIFYFSCMATITPPVCATVFLASGISGSKWFRTGVLSCLIALPTFIVPFTFAYNPSLLLIGEPLNIIISCITAIIGVVFIGIGVAGYINKQMHFLVRIAFVLAGVLMVLPNYWLSLAGSVICLVLWLIFRKIK